MAVLLQPADLLYNFSRRLNADLKALKLRENFKRKGIPATALYQTAVLRRLTAAVALQKYIVAAVQLRLKRYLQR